MNTLSQRKPYVVSCRFTTTDSNTILGSFEKGHPLFAIIDVSLVYSLAFDKVLSEPGARRGNQ